jgi:YesN/AraC family two-component response regulator
MKARKAMTRILNVDDNDAARYVKRRILSGAGYDVIDAATGAMALEALEREKPHMALVDMKLPDMSGFELTRRIRQGDGVRDMPVIQISAICVTPDDERDGIESGADAFLTMPVEAARLLEMVSHVIREKRNGKRNGNGNGTAAASSTGALNKARLQLVDAYIHANLHKRVMLQDLAEVARLSAFHFSRAFKAATGETPHAYLVKARVQAAMLLLSRTDLPIAEIGKKLGFTTAGHFTALFRKTTGRTPTQYRVEQKQAT